MRLPRRQWIQYGLAGLLLATASVAASFGLWKWLPTLSAWDCFWLWVTVQSAYLALAATAFAVERRNAEGNSRTALIVSAGATAIPLIALLVFVRVFVVGGSSNVAQIAGESGYELWRTWFHVWPLLFLGSSISWLTAVAATVWPPYPPRGWLSTATRLAAVLVGAVTCFVLTAYMPDA